MSRSQDLPLFEQHMQSFLAPYVKDIDAQSAVFNLDHGALDVVATMEGIALRPHDLSHAGFVLLMTLWITGPRETRELAAVLRVTKGAIVGSVNTLERRDLVRRERSDVDRRLVTVELTNEGRALIERVQQDWHKLELAVTSDLSAEEKRILAALCRKVAHSARVVRQRHGSRPELPDPSVFLTENANMPNKLAPARARR